MTISSNLSAIVERLQHGSHTTADLIWLGNALREGSVFVQESSSLTIGGDANGAVIVIGDGNTVSLDVSPETLQAMIAEAVSRRSQPDIDIEEQDRLAQQYLLAIARDQAWQTLSVGGTTVPLADLYVRLQAVRVPETGPTQPRKDIQELPHRLENAGIFPTRQGQPERSVEPVISLDAALNKAPQMVLLGEPGAGKSTTLQFIGLCLAEPGWAAEKLGLMEQRLPVRLELRLCAERLANIGPALEKELTRAVQAYLPELDERRVGTLLSGWSSRGLLYVLLDGLDEVPETLREAVRSQITRFVSLTGSEGCRVIIASRPAGYIRLPAPFQDYILKPFEEPEEMHPYLEHWLAVLKPGWDSTETERQASRLLNDLSEHPALRRLLDNPLILRLAAETYALDGDIARNRAGLYTQYLNAIWQRAEARGLRADQKSAVFQRLEELAWQLQTGVQLSTRELLPEDIVVEREKLGLLIRSGGGWYFSHITFQEFFAARHLQAQWNNNPKKAWAFLRPRLHQAAWREPLLLLAGLLDGTGVEALVRRVVTAGSRYEAKLQRDFLLACHLVGESGLDRDTTTSKLLLGLIQWKNWSLVNAVFSTFMHLVVIILPTLFFSVLFTFLSVLLPIVLGIYADLPLEIVFLAPVLNILLIYLLWRFGGVDYLISKIALRFWGLAEIPEMRVRAAHEGLLAMGLPAVSLAVRWLKTSNDDSRVQACRLLKEVGVPEQAIPYLQACLDDSSDSWVRTAALDALGTVKANNRLIEFLAGRLSDPQEALREKVAHILGTLRDPSAVESLSRALRDPESEVRKTAGWALGVIGDPAVVPDLQHALEIEDDHNAQESFRKALAYFKASETGPEKLIPDIDWMGIDSDEELDRLNLEETQKALPLLRHNDLWMRLAAIRRLQMYRHESSISALAGLLEDPMPRVRLMAKEALVHFSGNVLVDEMTSRLNHPNEIVRGLASDILYEARQYYDFDEEQLISDLLVAVQDYRSAGWDKVIEMLGFIKSHQAIPTLLGFLRLPDDGIREKVIKVLGEIGTSSAVNGLLTFLQQEENLKLRVAAIQALGEIGDGTSVPVLQEVAQEKKPQIRQAAEVALENIAQAIALDSGEKLPYFLTAGVIPQYPDEMTVVDRDLYDTVTNALQGLIDRHYLSWPGQGHSDMQPENDPDAQMLITLDADAVPILIFLLKNDDYFVQESAAKALALIGVSAVAPLLHYLSGPDLAARQAVVNALGRIGDIRAVPLLREKLHQETGELQRECLKALGQMGDMQVVPDLLHALDDDDLSSTAVDAIDLLLETLPPADDKSSRRSQAVGLRKIARALSNHYSDNMVDVLRAVMERLEAIEAI